MNRSRSGSPPRPSGRLWQRRAVDTALPSPDDIAGAPDTGPPIPVLHPYKVEAHSMIVLVTEE